MQKKCKNVKNRLLSELRSREGASLVLATIISIIIVSGVIILRVATSSLWASADKQHNQDQAYMMAVSLGDSIDKAIRENKISDPTLLDGFNDSQNTQYAISNSGISVKVEGFTKGADKYVVITVNSHVSDAEYEYKLTYLQVGSSYTRLY